MPIQFRNPSLANDSMTTKRLAKKIRVGHSTLEKMLSISSLSVKTFKKFDFFVDTKTQLDDRTTFCKIMNVNYKSIIS